MEDKILAVIRETLPEKEMGVIKKAFEERDSFKGLYESEAEDNKELSKELIKTNDRINELELRESSNIEKEKELTEKEKDIIKRETELEKKISDEKFNIMEKCFNTVLANTVVRKSINKNVPVARDGYVSNEISTEEEVVTEE